ncbi:hypothetical protein AB0G04_17590 [Actinoplanes sp. NPDC023801]|uniref:hypothetical protein n=1 Tax=Actinoplanes sp. NPDC023801 TaxID=3154595 RepID=UPI0033DE432E
MTMPRSASVLTAAGLAAGLLFTTPGVARASWHLAGSGAALAKAGRMPIVHGVTADATGSSVRVDWPAAEVRTGRPVAGYRVVRYAAGTDTAAVVGDGCSGTLAATGCTETGVPDGTWQYAVRAVQGSWTGAPSARSAVSVHTAVTPGTGATTFPVSGRKYGPNSWARTCPGICGTATASSGSTLTGVRVSLRRADGGYWNGSAFAATTEQFVTVTGSLDTWEIAFPFSNFPPADSDYTVRVVASDSGNRSSESTSTFTVDAKRPEPGGVRTANAATGTIGTIDAGDSFTLTYSETIDPASILSRFNGSPIAVKVEMTQQSGNSPDVLRVLDGTTALPIGSMVLGARGYLQSSSQTVNASMSYSATDGLRITFTASAPRNGQSQPTLRSALSWTAAEGGTDLHGNHVVAATVSEPGNPHLQF